MRFSGAVFRALLTPLKNPSGRARKPAIASEGLLSNPLTKHQKSIMPFPLAGMALRNERCQANALAHNGKAPERLTAIMRQGKTTHRTAHESVVFGVFQYAKIIRYKPFALVILYPAMI